MIQISILGCGWLGLPLAKRFLENNFAVNGSTTTVEKLLLLSNLGIDPYLISLTEKEVIGEITRFLENSKVLIIDIPPKLRGFEPENFVQKIKNLIPFIENSSLKKLIFVSSTSVYGDTNQVVTEQTVASPDTESGKQLLETEQLLLQNTNFETTIVRFGGLVAADRHVAKMLSGKINIQNPLSAINLIHQDDCIAIILKIIETQSWNQVYNAVSPYHPNRKEYYQNKATFFDLPKPLFDENGISNGKIVDSSKLILDLNYQFIWTENI